MRNKFGKWQGMRKKKIAAVMAFAMIAVFMASISSVIAEQRPEPEPEFPMGSLKEVPVPEPVNLSEFVKDKPAAIALGKALFWDMQAGSDGVQSCASCHFHAGADNRTRNSVSPGLLAGDTTFQLPGPNGTVKAAHFPLTQFQVPDRPGFEIDPDNDFLSNINDVISSQGVRNFEFADIIPGVDVELATYLPDPIFTTKGKRKMNIRRVEPRNAPSVINAAFNFSNFWDGRGRNIFNGVNPFGELDEDARVFVDNGGGLKPVKVRIPDASLASQAVGPPGNDFEMSSRGRNFPKIGKKLISLRPLAKQLVHPKDSVLGGLAQTSGVKGNAKGLKVSYEAMIKAAFHEKWWVNKSNVVRFDASTVGIHQSDANDPRTFVFSSGKPIISPRPGGSLDTDTFTQMEANFPLFFGLAIQLYEATLISDDSKFDRVMEKRASFTAKERAGFDTFMKQGLCVSCHAGAEFTNHSVRNVRNGKPPVGPGFLPENFIESMNMANRSNVIYDNGLYNIGVRPAGSNIPGMPGFVPNNEDIGRGNTAPIINPLTNEPYPLSVVRLAKLKAKNLLPPGVALYVPDLPEGVDADAEVAVDGAQKTPGLRNIELTGPYLHNGDSATLQQVVEFYVRGGNFPVTNAHNLDPDIKPLGRIAGHLDRQHELVAFLLTLTDERVRNEMAPFDHPQLFVPNGSVKGCFQEPSQGVHKSMCDKFIEIPAVGRQGRPAEKLPPLGTFLGLDPRDQ